MTSENHQEDQKMSKEKKESESDQSWMKNIQGFLQSKLGTALILTTAVVITLGECDISSQMIGDLARAQQSQEIRRAYQHFEVVKRGFINHK